MTAKKRRHAATLPSLMLVALACAAPAHGIPIHQSINLNTGTGVANGAGIAGPSLIEFELFDPSLGTLNSVDVRIIGLLSLTGQFHSLFEYPHYTIYQVGGLFEHRITGIGGGDFNLDPNSGIVFQHTVAGPNTINATAFYDMAFGFDATSDARGGFDVVSGGSSIANAGFGVFAPIDSVLAFGSISDFIGTSPAFYNNQWTYTPTSIGVGDGITFSYSGSMQLTYDYTPVAVPEPGTLSLLGLALLGLTFARRRPSFG